MCLRQPNVCQLPAQGYQPTKIGSCGSLISKQLTVRFELFFINSNMQMVQTAEKGERHDGQMWDGTLSNIQPISFGIEKCYLTLLVRKLGERHQKEEKAKGKTPRNDRMRKPL